MLFVLTVKPIIIDLVKFVITTQVSMFFKADCKLNFIGIIECKTVIKFVKILPLCAH